MERERATYDPDLPHRWLPGEDARECAMCGGYRDDELHSMPLMPHERAGAVLVTEKGS